MHYLWWIINGSLTFLAGYSSNKCISMFEVCLVMWRRVSLLCFLATHMEAKNVFNNGRLSNRRKMPSFPGRTWRGMWRWGGTQLPLHSCWNTGTRKELSLSWSRATVGTIRLVLSSIRYLNNVIPTLVFVTFMATLINHLVLKVSF